MAILFKIFWGKVDFVLAILTFLIAALDTQQNFMPTRYFLFSLSLLDQKLIVFIVRNLPKLNILSVIAIDGVKISNKLKDI